ncbi:Transcription initiation factor Rrn11 [Penicillium cf. griseofulvum]|uniref:Transcription initiation factor Rrn11 n=1 Tax=Penicillium cf. griseofulvum TaxID=2972120 RepID=A0A9W9MBG5_9EURO|nr:Transcription initiation factor Rrn11 [Penicillium cf. griseofulvum]KAJ5445450.1 Transcription initiation factor Rrn11 [Penicillium cf. griseofulvum]KAJ5447170.1 Transcription initiation factor Rrn11 [Penicillium cf. griseofulvum]
MAVPSSSVFSLPLPPWLQPPGTRVSQYDRRKRKRSVGWSESDLDVEETTDIASATESEPAGPPLVLTPNESHQYRIAGFPSNQELPKGHFPHEPDKDEQFRRETTSRHLKDLAALSPPVYPPQSAQQGNIRFQHLGTLTAILHRCMLQGDYVRAGRAWGLILREDYRGFTMDVRNETRWGIGAEILLRRDEQENLANHGTTKLPNAMESTPVNFTTKGFAAAKEYYERLILNHPFMKSSPQSISSLHFYPAMFGLWVYMIQEESKANRKNIALRQEEEPDEFSEDENSESEFGHRRKSQNKADAAITAIRALELEQAQQVAARMDQLLGSPPYSDSPELLELRGMISLWVGDLFLSALSLPADFEENPDPDQMLMDETPSSLEARREHRLATEKKATEVQRSVELFAKAKKRGRSVAYNMENLHIYDDSPG